MYKQVQCKALYMIRLKCENRMEVYIFHWCFLLLALFHGSNQADVIIGHYKAWWAAVTLPNTTVQAMLPDDFELVTIKDWIPPGTHPVVLEMGMEHDCGPVWPKPLQSTFMEFKYEIPFIKRKDIIKRKDSEATFNYKSIIYVDSEAESFASREVYRLNSSVVKPVNVSLENGAYEFNYNDLMFKAFFTPKGAWNTTDAYPGFKQYMNIMNLKWFGSPELTECAQHHYDFTSAKIRPAAMTVSVDHNLLSPMFPQGVLRLPGLDTAHGDLGTVEVDIHFTMTLPESCDQKKT